MFRRRELISVFGFLCLATMGHSNYVVAESITYSPDQWPRHWNVLMHKTNSQDRLNGNRSNNNYSIYENSKQDGCNYDNLKIL